MLKNLFSDELYHISPALYVEENNRLNLDNAPHNASSACIHTHVHQVRATMAVVSRVRPAGPTDAICLPTVRGQHPSSVSLPTSLRREPSEKNPKHSLDTHLAFARVTKFLPISGVVDLICRRIPP